LNSFSNLQLSDATLDVLHRLGFENPTPIQEKAIPVLLRQPPTDFIGLAQTGTGKTAAFGLPLIELIDRSDNAIQALILAPTRELGQQTAKQLDALSDNRGKLGVEVVYGGAPITGQIKALRKSVHILVATPGRLLDLVGRKAVNLSNVQYVVLDEADEMLNMGFVDDIDQILSTATEKKAIWLFSATMPREIRKVVGKYMKTPVEVAVNEGGPVNVDIIHQFVLTKTRNKVPAIRRFLDIQPGMRGILFCRTKRETQQVADSLMALGYNVEALHGDLSQAQRDTVMKRFRMRSMQLLVATDVASRGIDVSDLTHVFHHSLPDQASGYTHRSGRTGRAGKKGISIVFISPHERRELAKIEKTSGIQFDHVEIPRIEMLKTKKINSWAKLITNTEVDKQSEQILAEIGSQFDHLNKEELLKRLITTQLDHLSYLDGGEDDLNEALVPGKKHNNSEFSRYYVNLGVIDGLTKADLVHFLSHVSGIQRKHFGEVTMQKNCAFFEVNASQDKGLSHRFQGLEIEGRSVRVNRDDVPGKGRKAKPNAKSQFSAVSGSKNRKRTNRHKRR
jgi:ATP-dependent RNA helicase DeaD